MFINSESNGQVFAKTGTLNRVKTLAGYVKTKSGKYLHDNLDFGKFKQQYYYTFDVYTVPLDEIASVKIACNDKYGNQCIKTII